MGLTPAEKIIWRARDIVLAPPVAGASVVGPVVVAGLFRAASGVGKAARLCADDLEASGVEIIRFDLSGVFGQSDIDVPGLRAEPVAATRGTLILHCNAPETDRALLALRHFRPKRWRIVGCWVWETSRAPESWRGPGRRLSEIWTPSRFSAEAIRPVADCPVRVAPHPVAPKPTTPVAGAAVPLTMLAMADGRSSFHRKNPAGAVAAFRQAFPNDEPHRLIVKTRGLKEQPEAAAALAEAVGDDRRIEIRDGDLSEADAAALIDGCDLFISLHRAEGFGLPMGEAMARGKPVLATGWSGNMDYMDERSAFIAPFALVPARDPTGRYPASEAQWAEPDVAAAARMLTLAAGDPALRRDVGARAQDAIERRRRAAGYAALLGAPAADDRAD